MYDYINEFLKDPYENLTGIGTRIAPNAAGPSYFIQKCIFENFNRLNAINSIAATGFVIIVDSQFLSNAPTFRNSLVYIQNNAIQIRNLYRDIYAKTQGLAFTTASSNETFVNHFYESAVTNCNYPLGTSGEKSGALTFLIQGGQIKCQYINSTNNVAKRNCAGCFELGSQSFIVSYANFMNNNQPNSTILYINTSSEFKSVTLQCVNLVNNSQKQNEYGVIRSDVNITMINCVMRNNSGRQLFTENTNDIKLINTFIDVEDYNISNVLVLQPVSSFIDCGQIKKIPCTMDKFCETLYFQHGATSMTISDPKL